VPADDLTNRERAILLALMAEAREVTNAELRAVAGLALDGAPRRRLNDRKLVTSRKVGRVFAHELTDDGAAWCTAEMSEPVPPRAGYLGGALYALLAGLGRSGRPLHEIFRPDVEKQIRGAYDRLATAAGDWVGLAALREELFGVPRTEVDGELERMASTPGVHVQAESNQKALTDADRAAAVHFGGDDRHLLMIEAG
jgi:hypothetical protein